MVVFGAGVVAFFYCLVLSSRIKRLTERLHSVEGQQSAVSTEMSDFKRSWRRTRGVQATQDSPPDVVVPMKPPQEERPDDLEPGPAPIEDEAAGQQPMIDPARETLPPDPAAEVRAEQPSAEGLPRGSALEEPDSRLVEPVRPLVAESLPSSEPTSLEKAGTVRPRVAAGQEEPFVTPGPRFVQSRLLDLIRTWSTTGNVPVKVGVLLSLIGLGFLLGVALEQGWITLTIEVRHILVALFGVLLLVVGWRVRGRNAVYGLSLQGGGIAVLYLTTYVAHAVYDLLPALVAAVAVVVITVGAGVLAVLEDARSLAVLGIIGGFLAPVLAYSDAEDHLLVFGFYVILSAAIVAVAWFKTWPELNLLGLGFTLGVSVFWLLQRYVETDWSTTQPLIALLVVMYMTIPLLFAVRRTPNLKDWRTSPLVFGLPFAGLGLQALLTGHLEYGAAISALALAVIHGLFAVMAHRFGKEAKSLREAYSALGMAFLAIAVPLAFGAQYISIAWVVQGAFLVWVGVRQRQLLAIWGGILLQALAGAAFIGYIAEKLPYPDGTTPLINGYFLGAALLAATGLFTARILEPREALLRSARHLPWFVLFWGVGWWLCGGLMEVIGQMAPDGRLSVSIVFVAISLGGMALVGPAVGWQRMATSGVLLLPALALALIIALQLQDHPFGANGWAAWIVASGMYYAVLRVRESDFPLFMATMHAAAYWILAILIGTEVHWQIDRVASGVWPMAAALATVLAVVGATLVARQGVAWPLGTHWRTYLMACAGPALLVVVVMVLTVNLVSDGASPPLTYLPLLNPLEILTALVVVVALGWKRLAEVEEDHPLEDLLGRSWAPGLTVVGIILLTMAVVRTVHHWLEVPFNFDAMIDSTTLHASLSIVWGLAGLSGMVVGVRLVRRAVWGGGASLMGVVVVKLFLFDLSNTGTVARVVSFLGVGVLLLVVGYFAPVPPSASAQAEKTEALSE